MNALRRNAENYRIFRTMRCSPTTPIWEENGGVPYSQNVAYLGRWWGGGQCGGGVGFLILSSYFPPQNLRASYGPVRLIVRKIRYVSVHLSLKG